MSQLQHAGSCLEQERREHEEVIAAHESDLDICAPPQEPLEMSHGRHAAKSAAEHDYAHVPSRMACNSPIANPCGMESMEADCETFALSALRDIK
jgi:hypothetical protein